jgi:hypothetical protein
VSLSLIHVFDSAKQTCDRPATVTPQALKDTTALQNFPSSQLSSNLQIAESLKPRNLEIP